jgi:hypothetical protein
MKRLSWQLFSTAILVIGANVCSAQNPNSNAQTISNSTGNGSNTTSPATAGDSAKKASDDADKVEAAVAAAASLLADADKYQKTINAITMPAAKSTQPSLDDLQQLQTTVEAISRSNLIGMLSDAKTNIASSEKTRSSSCPPSQPSSGPQQDVTDATAKCTKAGKDVKDKSDAIDAAVSGLQTSLGSISPYVGDQVTALQNKLKRFSDTKLTVGSPDVSTILDVLPTNLPVLKQVLQIKDQYQITWNSTKALLSQLKVTAGAKNAAGQAATDPDDAFKSLQKAVDGILPNLDAWFNAITAQMKAEATSFDNMISGVLGDPARNSAAALDAVRKQGEDISSAQSVVDAWPPLVGFLVDRQPDTFVLKTTKADLEDLKKWTNVARGAVSRVHDALAGDFSGFETDQVSLYYFTDVQRLMYALNEGFQTMGGVAEAQEQAKTQRTALTQTELELADAQAQVNRYQKQVLDLQEQQRQAQAKLKGLSSNTSKLANRLNNAQDQKDQADADYNAAKSAQQAAPNDPTQTAALNKAAAKQTAAATKLSQSQSDYNAAKSDQDKTQSQVDDSQNQSDSLPAKLAAAQQALSDAQTAVAAERRKMIMAAQAESDAFAFARDNTPFMVAFADASSSNPAKRVMLYAFNDSKTIFMRGKRADLDEVKRIIAAFDQPAPQARLTLWTFELSAEAGQKANKGAAKKLNESMGIVDQELTDIRALQNTTLELLRDLINERVRQSSAPPNPLPNCPACTPADWQKLNRLSFYDPLVLVRLTSASGSAGDEPLDVQLMRREIPDPAATTTLGEALMVLSLAPPETRRAIRNAFESQILGRLRALPLSGQVREQTRLSEMKSCPDGGGDQSCFLPLTWHALGIWERDPVPGLTSEQLEITHALKTAYENVKLLQFIGKMQAWFDELPILNSQIAVVQRDMASWEDKAAQKQPRPAAAQTDTAKTTWVLQALTSSGDQLAYKQQVLRLMNLQARQGTIEQDSAKVLEELKKRGYDVGDIISKASVGNLDTYALPNGKMQDVKSLLTPVLSAATPSEAKADEMLKAMIIAIEDDLDRIFLQPMIEGLRKRLIADTGVNVGIMQRESMLATNRGKARVDPRASAQLAVGEQEDILAGVQQLAQLYGKVQTGGALAALGALDQLPREQQPEIYALTTGNKFEVTPIFDPSGQALRFKFDFVGSSNLQEPNGTTNPQFPRIERHTVNTEVQLSNLETREISRFESDSRLGLPTTYWGGVPILKDIPYVRPWIPLIGWFVRKAGSNAVAQQSVMFGQTTIYPSIQTMVSLLEDSETGPTQSQDSGKKEKKEERK